jgi:hypothetical protein
MTNCYFALNKEKPKLQKLKNLLEMNLYMGKSMEQQNTDAHRVRIYIYNRKIINEKRISKKY